MTEQNPIQQTNTGRRFAYRQLAELREDLDRLAIQLPIREDLTILAQRLSIGSGSSPNRLAIHPMEGCDGTAEGSPSDLTRRRYQRFAAGGAGLLWVEATAVVPEGRANPRQLWLHQANVGDFRDLLAEIDQLAPHRPYKVLQLTHSGRYAKPGATPLPQVAVANPYLDRPGQTLTVLTDEQLDGLVPHYVTAARLARQAGFDAVDIKACHRYLISELLSAHTRPGRYGGSLENRTRLLLDIVRAIRSEVEIDLAIRINAYDEIPYPFGWGVDRDDFRKPDLQESVWLLHELVREGVVLVDVTGGNPYYNPHVNRPYDQGPYQPPEHQLVHAAKLLGAARILKAAEPSVRIIATGLSWFRQFGGPLAAGLVQEQWCDLAGFGRQAFAYPDFAADMLTGQGMVGTKCCIACSKCSEIMRDGGMSGCVIKDREPYLAIYQAGRAGKDPIASNREAEHV